MVEKEQLIGVKLMGGTKKSLRRMGSTLMDVYLEDSKVGGARERGRKGIEFEERRFELHDGRFPTEHVIVKSHVFAHCKLTKYFKNGQ